MGFTPAQVDQMSWWQFLAVAGGVAKAHGADADDMTVEDAAEFAELLGV